MESKAPERMAYGIKTHGTTALPNALFDMWLPVLSDGEMRVLLVVARSTLGWKEGRGRKERDWISHSQLRRRTGRSNTPVSRAIETLVSKGLLCTEDEDGHPLLTPQERRAAKSRLFFRLGAALLCSVRTHETAVDHSSYRSQEHAATAGPALSPIPPPRFRVQETTKETGTNFSKKELSIPQNRIDVPQRGIAEEDRGGDHEEVQTLLEVFEETYHIARPGASLPPVEEADLDLLVTYVERGYGDALKRRLPAFFACSFGFVRRRRHSLRAYLDCFFILQANTHSSRNRRS